MIIQILQFLERHIYLLYAVLLLVTLATLGLTLLPSEKIGDSSLYQYDKLGHALMFGTWTFLLGLILLVSGKQPLPLFSVFLAGSIFGISVEILQEVLPFDRNMDVYDALADIIGCLIGIGFLKFITIYSSYGQPSREQ